MFESNLVAKEEEFDIARGKAGGCSVVERHGALGFVFAACAFEFGAFFAVDGQITVSVTFFQNRNQKALQFTTAHCMTGLLMVRLATSWYCTNENVRANAAGRMMLLRL
jgi:hypothetical protein